MHWTCDKCGKTLEISTQQLMETQGTVVCPQCLNSSVLPGYKRRKSPPPPATPAAPTAAAAAPTKAAAATPPPPPRRKPSPAPPPHRKAINFVDSRTAAHPSQQPPTPAAKPAKRKKPKKKNRRNGCLAPHTSVGCLWRSVAYTLLLLLLYSALGFLLQCT